MEQSEYLDIIPQRPVSMADMLKGREIKKQNIRKEFTDEVFSKLRGQWDDRFVGVMIGTVCPKGASDSFIHDIQKECQTARNYAEKFWVLYNKAKCTAKTVVKK